MYRFLERGLDMNIKKSIKIACIKKNISIQELANSIDMPRSTLYNKINGKSEFKKSELDKLFAFFGGDIFLN